jgi:hypothetical protein
MAESAFEQRRATYIEIVAKHCDTSTCEPQFIGLVSAMKFIDYLVASYVVGVASWSLVQNTLTLVTAANGSSGRFYGRRVVVAERHLYA